MAQDSLLVAPQETPTVPTISPIPAPEPPDKSTPTIAPIVDNDPSPLDENGEPHFGCGGTGQTCCRPSVSSVVGKCFESDDEPRLYDEEGNSVPGDYPSYGLGPSTCTCEPQEGIIDQLGRKISELRGVVTGATSTKLCNRYFAIANYSRIVDPGLNINDKRKLTPEVKDHLRNELKACLACVSSDGFYTSLGCIPFEANSLIKGLVLIGLFVSGILALFCIVISAIKIQLSRGESGKVSKAQENVKSCIFGLILIIFSAFIVNIFGSGILGFSILDVKKSEVEVEVKLECNRDCIYSQRHGDVISCYRGACPENEPECGKPGNVNNGCMYAPSCGSSEEVDCPAVTLTPVPSPIPTPPQTGTPYPTGGPISGGNTLVTADMVEDVVTFHNALVKSCGGKLLLADMSCVDNVNATVANLDKVKQQIKTEMRALGNPYFQCLGYIKAFMTLYTGQIQTGVVAWPSSAASAASLYEPLILTYPGAKQYELAFINKNAGPPLPGDFAKFRDYDSKGKPGFGHIAFVNGIINETQFTVLQANLGGGYTTCDGCISAMVVDRSNSRLTGYYRWQKKP